MRRGRDATRPTDISFSGWLDILARLVARLGSSHIALISAGVAFYGLLSLFPTITAGVALIGIFYDPETLITEADWLFTILPEAAGQLITQQLREVAGTAQGSLEFAAILSLAIALWSSSNATGSLIQGLGVIYEEEDRRGFLIGRLFVIVLTVCLIIGLALTLVIIAAIPAAFTLIGAGSLITDLAFTLRWPIMFALGVVGITLLYRYGPDRRNARVRWLTPGAVLACLLWVSGTVAFSIYVQSFGNYNETFGTLAGVIILLTWMWLSAFVVLLGALFDAELEAQTAKDTTVGRDRPMGQRGAVKADTLGDARNAASEEPQASGAR
ncbi:MAG: YihY/virulence factor BrkB family protein [Pseudomonadota bacterium]